MALIEPPGKQARAPGAGSGAPAAFPEGRREPVTVEVARREILAALPRLDSESVPISGRLAGRVLAAEVRARVTLPPFDNSALDGYAVRAADLTRAPVRLPVMGESAAGTAPGEIEVRPGTCAKVMTGAPMPLGSDSVVPYEWTDHGAEEVLIDRPAVPQFSVRRAGEDLREGDLVLGAGARIRPTDLAALAGCGLSHLELSRSPRVAVLSTGDELLDPGEELRPGAIYDTGGVAVEAQVRSFGGDVVIRGRVGDQPEQVERRMLEVAAQVDVLITTGGVSMGDHDHVRGTVERRGKLRLWRVAMRPGKPLAFGELGGAVFLGLPGNPVSASVTFLLFAAPALLQLQGAAETGPATAYAELLETVEKPEGLETFHRGMLEPRPGQLPGVRLTGAQGSGMSHSLVRADVLMVLPAEGTEVPRGSVIATISLGHGT